MTASRGDALAPLARLERLKTTYGEGCGAAKRSLLATLERRRLPEPEDVLRLHECLCFLRAYPDDASLLEVVERMLERFDARADLRRNRRWLEQTGIAGTLLQYPYYWSTARWLARRWPERITVDWDWWDPAKQQRLVKEGLPLLVTYSETPGLDMEELAAREWVARLAGARETDGAFLVRRFERLPGDDATREGLYDGFDIPMILSAGPDTPSRSRAHRPGSPVVFRSKPLDRARPDLRREVLRPPLAVRPVPPLEADRLIDLTREAMVTRLRDLYGFLHADRHDVRVVELGDGLQFVCFGIVPERRLVLEALHGFLTLQNGVPIGYVLTSSLFGSTEIAYNVFETFRSGEAARVFGRVLGTARHLFGARSFSIDSYQLGGYDNDEGLRSGAWWFYYKLGFRPRDPEVRRVVRAELAAMAERPEHRSSVRTLRRLAAKPLFWEPGRAAGPALGAVPVGNVGLRVSALLASRFGSERERGLDACAREAAERLGVRSMRRWSRGERLWWRRWSPLLLLLPGVERWSAAARRALVEVARAKGGPTEIEFVRRFDAHPRLGKAILALAEPAGPPKR